MITEVDLDTLRQIAAFTQREGYAPSLRDLAAALAISSTAIKARVEKLRDRGFVTWEQGKSRTLRVLKEA